MDLGGDDTARRDGMTAQLPFMTLFVTNVGAWT
jgi:hypothetical protein